MASAAGLDKICAVLDIEAFQHKTLLFYREIALAVVHEGFSEA